MGETLTLKAQPGDARILHYPGLQQEEAARRPRSPACPVLPERRRRSRGQQAGGGAALEDAVRPAAGGCADRGMLEERVKAAGGMIASK